MEPPIIILAYAASLAVAVITTAVFAKSIDRVLSRLIAEEISSSWALFIKFALFAAVFTGGMPADQGKFIGFPTPAVVTPVPGEGMMLVMKSIGAALMSAAWFLALFFGVTFAAGAAVRAYGALREKREKDAQKAEADRQSHPAPNDAPRKEPAAAEKKAEEPPKRPEAEGRRPVQKEEPSRPARK
ncbi:MAG: hypothetical protein PHS14_05230 [Elusimicrobia bacterium]|nr:hypothetical protein [Elusimicrobiota bacterium]